MNRVHYRLMIVTNKRQYGDSFVGSTLSKLTDVLVCQLMLEANPLRLMLHRLTVHNSVLELFHD